MKVDSSEFNRTVNKVIKDMIKEKKHLDYENILTIAGVNTENIKETPLYLKLVSQVKKIKNKILFKEIEKVIKETTNKGNKVDHEEVLKTLGMDIGHTEETIPLYAHITDVIKGVNAKTTVSNVRKYKKNNKGERQDNKTGSSLVEKNSANTQKNISDTLENPNNNNIKKVELEKNSSDVYSVTVDSIRVMLKDGKITFKLYSKNNDVQRNEVWDNNKKSLLIDTLLNDDIKVPTLVFVKKADTYMVADGKQRLISITSFINDKFKLSKSINKVGDIEVANLKFSQLPEELQNKILNSKITFQEIEYKSDEQVTELFVRLNSGEKLKSVEIWRASLGNKLPFVQKVARHRCFKYFNFTRSQVTRFYDVETALDLIMEELEPGSDHNKKTKENFVASNSKYADFVEDFKSSVKVKLDYFADTFDGKEKDKIKLITASSNKILIYRILDVAIGSGISAQEFYNFLEGYFTNKNHSYDKIAGRTSTSNKSSLEKRYKHLSNQLKRYIKNMNNTHENVNNGGETA